MAFLGLATVKRGFDKVPKIKYKKSAKQEPNKE